MHHMVRLCGQHALDIILHVAEDNSVSLGGLIRGFGIEGLDLENLQDRDREAGRRTVGIVKDGPVWENVSFSFIMMLGLSLVGVSKQEEGEKNPLKGAWC